MVSCPVDACGQKRIFSVFLLAYSTAASVIAAAVTSSNTFKKPLRLSSEYSGLYELADDFAPLIGNCNGITYSGVSFHVFVTISPFFFTFPDSFVTFAFDL